MYRLGWARAALRRAVPSGFRMLMKLVAMVEPWTSSQLR